MQKKVPFGSSRFVCTFSCSNLFEVPIHLGSIDGLYKIRHHCQRSTLLVRTNMNIPMHNPNAN